MGKGRVVILLSGWNPDSQFALSTKFVPWVVSLLEVAGGVENLRAARSWWGMTFRCPPGDPMFRSSRGRRTWRAALPSRRERRVFGTPGAGTYTVTVGGKDRQVVVNVDPVEGAPRRWRWMNWNGSARRRRRWPPTTGSGPVTPPKTGTRLDSIAEEGRQKLWRWFWWRPCSSCSWNPASPTGLRAGWLWPSICMNVQNPFARYRPPSPLSMMDPLL